MTAEALRQARETNPFRPFIIRISDGRSFRIQHRDYLSVGPSGLIAVVYNDRGGASMLDVMLITELTVDDDPPVVTPPATTEA